MLTRRRLSCTAGLMLAGFLTPPHRASAGWFGRLADMLAKIEADSGGRLGVALLDQQNGARAGHRSDERFPICSTFKVLAAGAILARVDAGKERLDRRIVFQARDLVAYSPITKERTGGAGMSVAELCEAAMTVSDNTAANLLLASLDGPSGVTAFARSLGDEVTRLDRIEPELNEAAPGDPRDTSSPAAMASNLHTLLFGDTLSAAGKNQLTQWLVACKTGNARIRAGLPSGWRVGDKTGTGERGTANDIAIAWPPGRSPILIAAYLTRSQQTDEQRNATLAAVGRAAAAELDS